jgi:hypothetical protein
MNFVPESISVKGSWSIPVKIAMDTAERMNTNSYTIGLKMLCTIHGVNFLNEVGIWMGNLGSIQREGDGWGLKPKAIPKPTLSAWYNGREKMPTWRLAQAVALLELVHITMRNEANAAKLPKDDMIWTHLKMAKGWFAQFNKKEELGQWLDLLRRALHERLKRDAGKSETAKQLFQHYENWLEECRVLGKKSNEVQTPS